MKEKLLMWTGDLSQLFELREFWLHNDDAVRRDWSEEIFDSICLSNKNISTEYFLEKILKHPQVVHFIMILYL